MGVFTYLSSHSRLVKLLEDIMDGSRILIFMDTKKGCDQITRQLRMDGWPALSIHGDKSQAERDWVLSEFKAGKSPIMTATDVAARGLGTHCIYILLMLQSFDFWLCSMPLILVVTWLSVIFCLYFWMSLYPLYKEPQLNKASSLRQPILSNL